MPPRVFPSRGVPATRAERVRMQLAAEILAGTFLPGTRLDEVAQSNRMGVSRTPLREAMRQLAAFGLVENRPHRGVVVAEGGRAALYETLAEVEAVCAALAAQRLDAIKRDELKRLVADDQDWLAQIHAGCGNSVLVAVAETLWQPVLAAAVVDRDVTADTVVDQSAGPVVQAIVDGDVGAARRLMRDYMVRTLGAFTAPAPVRRAC